MRNNQCLKDIPFLNKPSTSTIKISTNFRKLFTMKLTPEERFAYDELAENQGFSL